MDAHDTEHLQHAQKPRVQVAFMKDVTGLTVVFQDMGNTFQYDTQGFLVLDTRYIMGITVSETVRNIASEQYTQFVEEEL